MRIANILAGLLVVITAVYVMRDGKLPDEGRAVISTSNRQTESAWPPTVHREGRDIVISTIAFTAISPDGNVLALGHDDPMQPWFGLYFIPDNRLQMLPLPSRRVWIHPRWSPDSQRVVVASNAYDASKVRHDRSETQLELIDVPTGTTKTLVSGPGLRATPFFSRDGRAVYYFKGRHCLESCKTIGGHYDLFRVRLGNAKEEQLTSIGFYQAEAGDESADGSKIIFSADTVDGTAKPMLYSITLDRGRPEPFDSPLERIGRPRVDDHGRIYVSALAGRDESGRYIYDKDQRWQYSAFIMHGTDPSHPRRLLDLLWQPDKRLSRVYLSKFDIDAEGNIFHCISSHDKTRCSRAPTLHQTETIQ